MAMTEMEIIADLLEVLDRIGGVMRVEDNVVLARARTLLAIAASPAPKSRVFCDGRKYKGGCPSRLEFFGDLTNEQAAILAVEYFWKTVGDVHHCPKCREDVI